MITKRLLGLGLILASIGAILALLLNDLVGSAEYGGIGPLQRNIYLGAGFVFLLGLSLLPLGDTPA